MSAEFPTFITSNQGKLREVQGLWPGVVHLDLDLDEIQDLDPERVIRHKLEQAQKQHSGPILIEDTSLVFEGWGGLPGPFIKWFLTALSPIGLAELAQFRGVVTATAVTVLGLVTADGQVSFHRGEVQGTVVPPKGDGGFGWDSIFLPHGSSKTFGEMTLAEKQLVSMRQIAVIKAKQAWESSR